MDTEQAFAPLTPTPTARRPLLGLTVLVVEDSRFACEAMRLLCLRSGARIRRADCMRSARRHLKVYRPSVVFVDVGLPDGNGLDLIAELAQATPRPEVIIGTSGDEFEEEVTAAGADGFMAKPVTSLAYFQDFVLSRLPSDRQPLGPRRISEEMVQPDQLAFQDDMAHIVDVLEDNNDERTLDYVAQFLSGVARSAHDDRLAEAAEALAKCRASGLPATSETAVVAGLLHKRLVDKIMI